MTNEREREREWIRCYLKVVGLSNLNVAGSKQYFHVNKTDFLRHLMILELRASTTEFYKACGCIKEESSQCLIAFYSIK